MPDYKVELKVICTQTVKVTAKNEDDAEEKAAGGEFHVVTDYEYHENYKQDDWKITKTD